jgi:hypothetical protein
MTRQRTLPNLISRDIRGDGSMRQELPLRRARPDGIGDEPTLGLHVAGTLAARTGVAVHLLPIEQGCVAAVVVPPRLLSPAVPEPAGDRAGAPAGLLPAT